MQFLNPLFLWSLLLLSLPVLVHLLSPRSTKTIRWAAMQFLSASDSRSGFSKNISEIILLSLRLFCLLFFILFLVGISYQPKRENRSSKSYFYPSNAVCEAFRFEIRNTKEAYTLSEPIKKYETGTPCAESASLEIEKANSLIQQVYEKHPLDSVSIYLPLPQGFEFGKKLYAYANMRLIFSDSSYLIKQKCWKSRNRNIGLWSETNATTANISYAKDSLFIYSDYGSKSARTAVEKSVKVISQTLNWPIKSIKKKVNSDLVFTDKISESSRFQVYDPHLSFMPVYVSDTVHAEIIEKVHKRIAAHIGLSGLSGSLAFFELKKNIVVLNSDLPSRDRYQSSLGFLAFIILVIERCYSIFKK
jgi:hypothetical protein